MLTTLLEEHIKCLETDYEGESLENIPEEGTISPDAMSPIFKNTKTFKNTETMLISKQKFDQDDMIEVTGSLFRISLIGKTLSTGSSLKTFLLFKFKFSGNVTFSKFSFLKGKFLVYIRGLVF